MKKKKAAVAAEPLTKKKETWGQEIKRNWQLYVLMIIPMLYLLIFKYYPMVGVQIAFRNYKPVTGIWGSDWVGMKHFIRFFNNPQWLVLVKNTIAISLYTIVLTIPFPIMLAIAFDYARSRAFKKTVQMVTFLPHVLSTVIVVSLLNLIFDNRTGVVNNIIQLITGSKINFLGESRFYRSLFVWSGIWQNTGWSSILYISALAAVDTQVHEAAIIDGANKLRRIWHIDLTTIRPTIAIMIVMKLGSVLSVGFDKSYMMQNAVNLEYSEVLSTYEYKIGTGGLIPNYSYSTAIGLMVSLINMVLVVLSNKASNKLSGSGLW